jgi:dienelactone hydrolase
MGAPALDLATVVVDLAQSARFELVCDGPKLVALRQAGRALIATRASFAAVGSALEAWARSKPRLPATLAEVALRVPAPAAAGSPPATLSCALVAPLAEGERHRGPAVLLLGDAGLHDRDGDPVGPGDSKLSLLKRLAVSLGEEGIASLRCDDRGASGPPDQAPRPSLEALTSDARAALAALRKQPSVDPAAVGLLGHGQGGLVAALVNRAVGRTGAKLRSLALLATPGRPLDALVLADTEETLRRFGYPEPEIRETVARQKAVYDAVRARKPLPATLSAAERTATRKALPWLRSQLALDPASLFDGTELPALLLVQGGKDDHLRPQDFDRLRAAAEKAGRPYLVPRLYPDLNHPFAPAATGSLIDYLDPRADVSEEFLADVALFHRRALSGEPPAVAATSQP